MSSGGQPTDEPQASTPQLPRFADVRIAFAALTVFSRAAVDVRAPSFGRAAPLFPLAGAAVGALLVAIDWLVGRHLPAALAALLVLAIWEISERGRLTSTEPSGSGAKVATLVAKLLGLWLLTPRGAALLFAPVLGAWSVVVLAVGAREADHPGRKLAPGVLFNEFAVASLLTLAAVFSLAEGLGILLGVVAAALIVGLRVLLHQRLGGMTTRWLVLGAQLIEVVTLWLLVALQHLGSAA